MQIACKTTPSFNQFEKVINRKHLIFYLVVQLHDTETVSLHRLNHIDLT